MLAAVLCAGVTGWLVSRLLGAKYAQEPLKPIVVAARDLPPGEPLSAADVRVAQWPISSIPRGAFGAAPALLASDAVPMVSLLEGSPVLAGHLSRPGAGIGVAAKLRKGLRAVAIESAVSVTLARLLYPGARVDVLSTFRGLRSGKRRDEGPRVKTKVILQNVPVLAVGRELQLAGAGAVAPNGGRLAGRQAGTAAEDRARRVVTLGLNPDQTERLTLARRFGVIDLALRSPHDEDEVPTLGATPKSVLGAADAARTTTRESAARSVRP